LEKAILLVKTQLDFAEHGLLLTARVMQENVFPQIKWMGTKSELVELVYALHDTGVFGEASLKEIFAVICKIFDCEIKNYHRLFWDIRSRKGEQTPFLKKIIINLVNKYIRMDN
jgi:hypothetical protein